jgi:hypothetical protein
MPVSPSILPVHFRAVQPHQQQMFGEELPSAGDGEQPGPARRKRHPSTSESMPLYTLCKEDLGLRGQPPHLPCASPWLRSLSRERRIFCRAPHTETHYFAEIGVFKKFYYRNVYFLKWQSVTGSQCQRAQQSLVQRDWSEWFLVPKEGFGGSL